MAAQYIQTYSVIDQPFMELRYILQMILLSRCVFEDGKVCSFLRDRTPNRVLIIEDLAELFTNRLMHYRHLDVPRAHTYAV